MTFQRELAEPTQSERSTMGQQIAQPVVTVKDGEGDFDRIIMNVLSTSVVKTGVSLLVDRRGAIDDLRLDELRSRAQWIAALLCRNPSPRCALVARQRPHSHYGFARTIATFLESDGINVEVFTDITEAERWLING